MSLHLKALCAVLTAIGLGVFLIRWLVLGYPLAPREDAAVWQVEIRATLIGDGGPARVGLYVPPPDGRYGAAEEDFAGGGLRLNIQDAADGNRAAIWSANEFSGRAGVRYRGLHFRRADRDRAPGAALPPDRLPEDRRFPPRRSAEDAKAAGTVLRDVRPGAADAETLAALLVQRLAASRANDADYGILSAEMDDAALMETAAYILSTDGVAARAVRGFPLGESRRSARAEAWLEVWTGKTWLSLSPDGDRFDPSRHLIWWRGEGAFLTASGARIDSAEVALVRQTISGAEALRTRASLDRDGPLAALTLLNLPVGTQMIIRLLLIIPLGGLLLVVLRQVIGLSTIGTFMPVLIALAFEATGAAYGVIFFSLLVGVGLLARMYFARFNLLLVPRLAAMLIVVIFIMIGAILLADRLGVGLGAAVSLFPIVVLTMTIERMAATWDETGPRDALTQGLGSLVVAVIIHLIMQWDGVIHLLFTFPELMLVILAITLLMGRYSGYRLTELWRFRDVLAEERAKSS